jgi:hypothetical protein
MQSILITLTTAGADTDNFSLYTDLDGYTTPIETGISKAFLVIGYVSNLVPDGATVIRVQSVSACTNYVDFPITGITTTTTSTTTSTTTPEPTTTSTTTSTTTPEPTTTSTTTSTTTPEPTTTSTTTSTTTAACDCTYYNVVVTSEDINNATGNTNPAWNNTVWAYYYDCGTGTYSDVIYSSADNYYHSLCNNNNILITPYLYNHINDAATVVVSSTITNSLDCCSSGTTTTTSTTTSTTTPAPTTTSTTTSTTTPSPTAQIDITNDSYDVEIGSVNAGGASTTGGSFPNSTGNGTNVFTDISISIPGTYQIDVYITAGVPGQSVTVTDSNGSSQCQTFSLGAYTLSFTGVYIDNITNVIIHAAAGTC